MSSGTEPLARPALEPESADEPTRALWAGVRLVCGATAFFFFPFVYAFFYLRAIDSHAAWRPAGVEPPLWVGIVAIILVVKWSGLARVAYRAARRHAHRRALVAGWASLASGLAAIVVQVVGYASLGFGPASGAYASVYVAATGALALVLLGATIWLETVVVALHRTDLAPDGLPLEHVKRLQAIAFYALFLTGVAVVLFVLLYVVR